MDLRAENQAPPINSPSGMPPIISTPPILEPPARSSARRALAVFLNLCLGLFLADGLVAVLDFCCSTFWNITVLAGLHGVVSFLAFIPAVLVYALMAIIPGIPKRLFVPVALFTPATWLAAIPVLIYAHERIDRFLLGVAVCQVLLGIALLMWVRGGGAFQLPLIGEQHLKTPRFSWLNLLVFAGANLFVLVPAVLVYLFFCTSLAVGHFSEGFLALRPRGLTAQVRTYTRNDGKKIELAPMAHVGEAEFYRRLSGSFPSNSVVLMEGVSDENNRLTNKITYKRMATSLHLSEQQREFKPQEGKWVRADIDVEQFSQVTIDFLNLAMRVHVKGLSMETLMPLLQYKPPDNYQELLWNDLLYKRNEHLLEQIQQRLDDSDTLIVPWGAAHMPGISEGIRKAGFRLEETREYRVIRFGRR